MPRCYAERLAEGSSPAAERNKGPILEVLRQALPREGLVLEIGTGTGQHVLHFAAALPELTWQPTDLDAANFGSIARAATEAGLANVRAPLVLDVLDTPWPVNRADALIAINVIHIAPWPVAESIIQGASHVLCPGGVLFLYGPYRRFGAHTARSNESFDASLRRRNPEWGVRDLQAVNALAEKRGLILREIIEMPANNFSVVFQCPPSLS